MHLKIYLVWRPYLHVKPLMQSMHPAPAGCNSEVTINCYPPSHFKAVLSHVCSSLLWIQAGGMYEDIMSGTQYEHLTIPEKRPVQCPHGVRSYVRMAKMIPHSIPHSIHFNLFVPPCNWTPAWISRDATHTSLASCNSLASSTCTCGQIANCMVLNLAPQ